MSQIHKIKKSLRQGEKALRDGVPIRFNEWNSVTAGSLSNLPKTATVKFTVLTNNHGVGASNRQKETSYGSQMGLRLDRIEDNPKSVIETWQSIRNELMPRMADVDAVSAVELFGAHLTGAATREYSQILFDCAEKLYVDMDAAFNERYAKWTIADKANSMLKGDAYDALSASEQTRAVATARWSAKNDARTEGRKNKPVAGYSWSFPPEPFTPPPEKPSKDQFFNWGVTGTEPLNQCAWLRSHRHGWEYMPHFFQLVFKEVQVLAFKSYGKNCGRQQIDYLSEDLALDTSHSLKNFFRLLQAHSEAQPYYPVEVPAEMPSGASEEGSVFSSVRKIQIVWNACFEQFKAELHNIQCTRRDDFGSDYKLCQEKFLLAEQHKKDGLVRPVAQGKPKNDANKSGNHQKKPRHESGSQYNPSTRYNGNCGYCQKRGHHESVCTNNPANRKTAAHGSKRPYSANPSSAGGNKKHLSKEAWIAKKKAERLEQDKEYEAYALDFTGNEPEHSE